MNELAKEHSKYMTIPKQPGSQYTNEQRFNVIADLFVIGNITKTAEMHNMPKQTVHNWARSEWGVELLGQIGTEKGEELDANFTKLIDVAFDAAEDRIKNGDFRLVKTKKAVKHDDGSLEVAEDYELKRVPMNGKDLIVGGAVVYDKRQLHRNQPTAITECMDNRAMAEMCKELSRTMSKELGRVRTEKQVNVVATQEKSEEIE